MIRIPGSASTVEVLVIHVDDQRIAIPLSDVTEVLPAMALTPLPDGPDVVRGVANLRGRPMPVISMRERLGLPLNEPMADHHVLVCEIADRPIGVWVDSASDVTTVHTDGFAQASTIAAARHLTGAALQPDGLILVYDVRSFRDADEELRLEEALAAGESRVGSSVT